MTCAKCGCTIGWDCECDPEYNQLAARIAGKVAEIIGDRRYAKPGKCATVFENAPLALMQMGWESEVKALRWVLEML